MASNNVVKVTPGKGYTLTGKAGAAVQCVRDGKVYVPASLTKEGQVGFTAPCAEVEVVGDGFVTENFRSAALALGSGGGEGGGGGVAPEDVASLVSNTFKLAVGSDVPKGSADAESIALGGFAEKRGLAIGYEANAMDKSGTIALGYKARAYGSNGVCIGAGAWSTGERAIAIGNHADAAQNDGVAIGPSAKANKDGAIALGTGCKANGLLSIAIGYCNTAAGDFCTVIGAEAQANSNNCLLLSTSDLYRDVAMTMELRADDLKSVPGGNGEVGDPYLSFSGGKLRFALVDRLAGKKQAITIKAVDLWRMLHDAGGLAEYLDEDYYG